MLHQIRSEKQQQLNSFLKELLYLSEQQEIQ